MDVPDPPLHPPVTRRLRVTAFALTQLLLAVPTVVLLVLWVFGGALLVVWAGILVLAITVPATRCITDLHRRMAADVLGTTVPRPYLALPAGNPVVRLVASLRDPMTWRDVAWMVWAPTFGLVVALVCLLELLLIVTLPVWWYGVEAQMRIRSQIDLWFLASTRTEQLEQRVELLTETRADVVDHSAAELRRLERDLHDGAQARLVALSMSLGLAEQLLTNDPPGARRLLSEARATASATIVDLRSVVRGIHPPVLADRGLAGAVLALALDMGIPVEVTSSLVRRPPAPVESAVYFAVAECLANIGKHAGATRGWIRMTSEACVLRVEIGDDGRGGATPSAGTGMLGIQRRLAAFDGSMSASSPTGGPTLVTLEVPCDSSWPRTTPSSVRE